MRTVELAKVAAAAEALRLRRIARRQGLRGAFAAGAAVFATAIFVLLHVLAYHLMVRRITPVQATLILLAFDLIVAAVLAFLATRNTPDSIEREAMHIRRQAVVEMRKSVTMMAMAAEVTGLVLRRRARAPGDAPGHLHVLGEIASRVLARR